MALLVDPGLEDAQTPVPELNLLGKLAQALDDTETRIIKEL